MHTVLATDTPRSLLVGLADMACLVLCLVVFVWGVVEAAPMFFMVLLVPCIALWVMTAFIKRGNTPFFPVDASDPPGKCSGGICGLVPAPISRLLLFACGVFCCGIVCLSVMVALSERDAVLVNPVLLVVFFSGVTYIRFTARYAFAWLATRMT